MQWDGWARGRPYKGLALPQESICQPKSYDRPLVKISLRKQLRCLATVVVVSANQHACLFTILWSITISGNGIKVITGLGRDGLFLSGGYAFSCMKELPQL